MSIVISTDEKTVVRQVLARTWHVSITTQHDNVYRATIRRERLTRIDGKDQQPDRNGVDPTPGPVAEGEDGTDPSHYTKASGGFANKVEVVLDDLTARTDAVVYAGHTYAIKDIPGLIAALCDKLALEEEEARKTAVIAAAVEAALPVL